MKCKRCGEKPAKYCNSCLVELIEDKPKEDREKLASWQLTLEKCYFNLPEHTNPVHRQNLDEMIDKLRLQQGFLPLGGPPF